MTTSPERPWRCFHGAVPARIDHPHKIAFRREPPKVHMGKIDCKVPVAEHNGRAGT